MVKLNLVKENNELSFFNVTPKVVPANELSIISIEPLYENVTFHNNIKYDVIYEPMFFTTETANESKKRKFTVSPENGIIHIKQYFAEEQEHVIKIIEKNKEYTREIGTFHIYSLKPDLFKRKPLKGDLHVHSCRSDGQGSPAYIAALGRMVGFDFMSLTDHGQFLPSIETQKSYEDAPIDFLLIKGEEVHPPESSNHLINFGGDYSVNKLYTTKKEQFKLEVKTLQEECQSIPEGVDSYEYVSFVWSSKQIQKAGGLSIFCHPYWVAGNQHYVSDKFTSYLLKEQPFDALELINGTDTLETNTLQVSEYYNHLLGQGYNEIPVVGVSDTHNCDLGVAYTIVFVEKSTKNNIIKSIKDFYSVAVENLLGESIRVHGPSRLVRFANFLNREIFSKHDILCYEEGRYMMEYIKNGKRSIDELKRLKGRVKNLYEMLWK